MKATIHGHIIPAVRMTQGGKWVKARPQEYLDQQERLAWELKAQLAPLPDHTPIGVTISFWRKSLFQGDIDNLTKAIVDALQGAGIIPQDSYVVCAYAEKYLDIDGDNRTEIKLWAPRLVNGTWSDA